MIVQKSLVHPLQLLTFLVAATSSMIIPDEKAFLIVALVAAYSILSFTYRKRKERESFFLMCCTSVYMYVQLQWPLRKCRGGCVASTRSKGNI